ncbi:hypothetical protein [Pantoea sp. CFSAN033090]|uniref:hypothetical protein n=1 Tax=Pantoea sp. CFSAN033090 TaxID=1690502 RepID=UPI00068B180A|nr:hypothetical protein [Pantoea sp. CFSAN033090]KOA70481.1 hypothetical protein AFL22_11240 [Pantoea sp. CFSAN033090]
MTKEQKQALIDEIVIQALRDDVRHWQQRAEAAEAKLAELEKQKPVGTVSIAMDWNTYRNVATVNMRHDLVVSEMKDGDELFTRPAPAADLDDLVPDELTREAWRQLFINEDYQDTFRCGFSACRAAILRNIEEAK